jgi:predicted anti-sigma-YlaC factor YlaD
LTVTVSPWVISVPDVVRSITAGLLSRAAALKVWAVPPLIEYVNWPSYPAGLVIALSNVMLMAVPAGLVVDEIKVGTTAAL